MEGSVLANPTRRQASGADTALSNAVTSVTVSQQESEGQASEPAAGSTGGPPSPRAARSQVSTAVSFEGARAAGSAVQPERSVDEDSALSAAEPDGHIQAPRPANSLISTAVHRTFRNTSTGGKLALLAQQHHASQQRHQQAHQQALLLQHLQQYQAQQQRYALPALLAQAAHGRGAGPSADHYASSPEVQRPHSINSQAAETRGEGRGHAGRDAAEHTTAPGYGARGHPSRANARGATPASVHGQIQTPGGAPGSPSTRKARHQGIQWHNAIGGGGSGLGGMDPAAAAAAAAAAFLGNGLVGGWGLMQGLGQGAAQSIGAAGQCQPPLPHSFLAAAAAGASGTRPLPSSPFNFAALGHLQLQTASHLQQQAAAAAASAGASVGISGDADASVLWQSPEQNDSVLAGRALPQPPGGSMQAAAAPASKQHREDYRQLLPPSPQQQLLQAQVPPAPATIGGDGAGSSAEDAGDGWRSGGVDTNRAAPGGPRGTRERKAASKDVDANRQRSRQARSPYGLPAALLGPMYGGGHHQFALADMHGLQELLMSASMTAAAAAAVAASGVIRPAEDGAQILSTSGSARANQDQPQLNHFSSQLGPGPQHLLAHSQHQSFAAHGTSLHAQQQQHHNHNHQEEVYMSPVSGYVHSKQQGEAFGTGNVEAAAMALSAAGRTGAGAAFSPAAAGGTVMQAPVAAAAMTATSVCGDDHGMVVDGSAAAGPLQGTGAAPSAHPAMQLYVPVMLPLDLVSAQLVMHQAAAAVAVAAGTSSQVANAVDAKGSGPAGGVNGAPPLDSAGAAVHTIHSTQALRTSPQCFAAFEHESCHQDEPDVSVGGRSHGSDGDACGRSQVATCAVATSVARGGGPNINGNGAGGLGTAMLAACGHAASSPARSGVADARDRTGNVAGPSSPQHSAGSYPGADSAGARILNFQPGTLGGHTGAQEGHTAVAPLAVSAVETASVVAPGAPVDVGLPPEDMAEHSGAAGGGATVSGSGAAGGAAATASAGFGAVGPNHHNLMNNAHSNAYGAGPSMTQTADYRSHLQVALSLLLQATSAAYHSQRQSGIAGANEGSGVFAAGAQQASASNAVEMELSEGEGAGGSGPGAGCAAGGVGSRNDGDAGVVSSGGAAGGSGPGRSANAGGLGSGADNRAASSGGTAAAAAAHSMRGVLLGPAGATGAMETEGQVVDQAPAVGRGLHAGPSIAGVAAAGGGLRNGVAGANLRQIGDGAGDCSDGGGARASPDAYQAPQWSTQRGGGGGGGILDEGARSIMYGSSGAAALAGQGSSLKGGGGGAAGTHAHMSTHHGLSMGHQHHHHHRHHAQGLPQSPIGHYHHHRAGGGAAVGSGSASGKAAALEGQGCSPGMAQLEGGLMIGGGHGAGTVVAAAGASVGSAGGAAAGDGEQGDNNSALQMDAEAGHPAASVHATVIAEESDASQEGGGGGGGDDSDSMEVPPVVAGRGLNGSAAGTAGGGAVTGQGGRVAAAAGSSMAAREACLGEIASKLFEGSRSPSREGQASKQPHDQVLFLQQGPPAAGVGLGEVASHRAEARSPARHDGGFLDPRDSSMGMAAGPSQDGADSSSNGATTSDTVDMADDSRMASASEHDDSRMGVNPRDRLLVDDYHLPMDEQGGENGGTVGDGGQDVEERGDDNDNAGSADVRSGRGGRHGRGRGRNADDLNADGDGNGGGRMSVGLAAALLGMLGGCGDGRVSTRHMGPATASDDKDSPAEKAVSHQADNNPPDQIHNHHQPGNHYHTQGAGMEMRRGGSAGVGHRASNNGTAPIAHHNQLVLHHHHNHHGTAAAKAVAAVALYGACAAATVAALAGDMSAAVPAPSGAATMGAAADGSGGEAPRVSLHARGSPALQAANSTAMGSALHGHCSPCQLGGEESGGKRQEAAGYSQPRVPHTSREDRRPVGAAAATAISCGLGPAYSASNADRLKMGGRVVNSTTGLGGAIRTSRSNSAVAVGLIPRMATGGGAAAPVASSGDAAAGEGEALDVIVKPSSQEAAGGVRHRKSSGRPETHVRSRDGRQYLQRAQTQLPPPSQQHQVPRVRNEGELASSPGGGTNLPSSHPKLLQPHPIHHHPYLQLQQQQHDSHTQVQQFAARASAMTVANVQQIPSHHTYPEVQPHGHQHGVVHANANTTLAAVNGGATLNQASILTTASQPHPPPLPLLAPHHTQQPYNALTPESGSNAARLRGWSSAGNAASVGRGHGTGGAAAAVGFSIGGASVEAPAMTHGSAGRGHGTLTDRFSREAELQVMEIHGAFPGMAATAAEALALYEEEEWQRSTAAASAAEAAMAAAAGPAAGDAQASWMGHVQRQPSGSPGGRTFSAVAPQFTEVHGAFMRTAGTAAEAQAAVLRGADDSSNRDAGAGASGEKPGELDPRVSDGRGQCTLQAGARLTVPRDAEYMGASITCETAGGVAAVDGRGSQWQGHAIGTSVEGAMLATYHPSQYQELQPAAGGASGLGTPYQQLLTAAVCGSSTAATGAVATRAAAGGGGGPPGLGAGAAATSNNSDSKAESALHLTPASRAASRGAGSRGGGGGGGGGGWTLRSGRAMGSHDGQVPVPRRARGGAAVSVDGHGSNGGVPPEPCDGDNVAAMAAVSQSGEVMLPPQGHDVGGAASAAGVVAAVMALRGITVAAADMRHSSRRVAPAGQPYGNDPALSGSASHGPGGDDGDVLDCGAITPDTRHLARHGLRATARGLPGRPYRTQSTLLHPLQQLPPQPQPGLQLLAGSGCGGGATTAAAAAFHAQEAAEGPLSTQAHAYGGYDDEYDSDGLRRRTEGPPQPQMTILVTSQGHAANSHHTVSGGAAVGSEADNGIAGAEHGGGGGSPAVAAWEEEFDGPHRPTGMEGLAQQGSWRGGEGDLGGGPTKSAVMSSGRVEAPPHSHQSMPMDRHRHHHHHLPQHPRYDPHEYLAGHGPLEGPQGGILHDQSAAGGAWAVGATVAAEQPAPVQLSDGEVVGSGGAGSGRGTTRGMRRGGGSVGRGRIRGSKRKRTLESSEPDEDSKFGGGGGRGGGCG